MTQKLSITTLILAFLGFLDATYLTIEHYKNAVPPCSLAHGCETVLTSQYATIFGIPIALIGVGFYLVIMVLTGLMLQNPTSVIARTETTKQSQEDRHASLTMTNKRTLSTLLLLLTGMGVVVALLLIFIQAFVLHAFCQYCLGSEIIDFLLFGTSLWLWKSQKTSVS